MKKLFGTLANGESAYLYTITRDGITALISDLGATLVKLLVPDAQGNVADVVLGYDDPQLYVQRAEFLGATVGRNSNRIGGARFTLNGKEYTLEPNDNEENNLHGGFQPFKNRLWTVCDHTESKLRLALISPSGDQGMPGNAEIHVTYALEAPSTLRICYDAISDQDTVFNFTNHSYFNLAGHDHPERSMEQTLSIPGRFFNVSDALSIPTGELRSVSDTPMDFRIPKPIGRDINDAYEPLQLQGGYDHNFEVFTDPCAILTDPTSGRTMAISTDLPGIQLYTGNFLKNEPGKDGAIYPPRSGICLETQFYPDAVNHPEWPQPFVKANQRYHSETKLIFR